MRAESIVNSPAIAWDQEHRVVSCAVLLTSGMRRKKALACQGFFSEEWLDSSG